MAFLEIPVNRLFTGIQNHKHLVYFIPILLLLFNHFCKFVNELWKVNAIQFRIQKFAFNNVKHFYFNYLRKYSIRKAIVQTVALQRGRGCHGII